MGKATGLAHQEQIVSMKLEGDTLQSISETLSLTFSNVRDIWRNYTQSGSIGLLTHYDNCGQRMGDKFEVIYRASIWLKHLHPLWGSPRIHAGLKSRYGDKTPTIRTLNRWYKAHQLVKPRSKTNQVHIGSAKAVHNIWQVDAKEHLVLLDGREACYLTIVDEKSGAWLTSLVFPLWTYLSGFS